MTNPADIPQPLPWEQRSQGVVSMPGGYAGYIQSLRRICEHVVNESPSRTDLGSWVQKHLAVSQGSPKVSFLEKVGVFELDANQINLSEYAKCWYEASDDGILIGLLHSHIRYLGELLAELRDEPQTTEELREAAIKYDLNWDSHSEVNRRRGWLESAKLIEPAGRLLKPAGSNRIAITDSGRGLLEILSLHKPDKSDEASQQRPPAAPATSQPSSEEPDPHSSAPTIDPPASTIAPSTVEALANEIREASTESKNPDRLEIAVRDAFQLLGFDAEKLGGSGKTDVLVRAPLGRDDSYSVTIDAKTVGAGSLGDGQVDWVTLDEHRRQHDADYSMLVGPNPSGSRLMNRAIDKSVAVLSTEQLADLCIQHTDAPLGLESYRTLFDTGGAVNMAPLETAARDLARTRDLAVELCGKLAERTSAFGPLTASQLMVMLDQPDKPSSEQEIQQVLDTLASPLVGAIQGTADKGYVLATAPRVIQQRLQQIGDLLAAH